MLRLDQFKNSPYAKRQDEGVDLLKKMKAEFTLGFIMTIGLEPV